MNQVQADVRGAAQEDIQPDAGACQAGQGGPPGCAAHAQFREDPDAEDQKVIEQHVDDVGNNHDVERRLHVAQTLQDGVDHHHGQGGHHRGQHDAQVRRALSQDKGVHLVHQDHHQLEHPACAQHPADRQDHGQYSAAEQRLPHDVVGHLAVARPDVMGDQGGGRDGHGHQRPDQDEHKAVGHIDRRDG